jgi:hypothetical protein
VPRACHFARASFKTLPIRPARIPARARIPVWVQLLGRARFPVRAAILEPAQILLPAVLLDWGRLFLRSAPIPERGTIRCLEPILGGSFRGARPALELCLPLAPAPAAEAPSR